MDAGTIRIRDAVEADTEAVVALVESAYRGEVSRGGWTTEADLLTGRRTGPDEVGPSITGADSLILLAEDHLQLLGCCRLDLEKGRPYFGMLAVRPTAQGRGVGARLMAAAEARAAHWWGAVYLEMTVLAQRPELIAFYGRHGYLPTGETRPFPYGDERFGVPLRDDLSFVVLSKALSSG